jgi:hypothetical protein
MKSVFYILTIHKVRYVAIVESGDTVVTVRPGFGGYFQAIRNGRIVKQATSIGAVLQ